MTFFAVRNKETKKILSKKSNGGKFYTRKTDALKSCFKQEEEVIEFLLIRVETKQQGKMYVYSYSEQPRTNNTYTSEKRIKADKYYIYELKEVTTY